MTRVVVLGLPDASRYAHAERIAVQLGVPYLSFGDCMRAAVAGATSAGTRLKAAMDEGALAPKNLVLEIMRDRLLQLDCAHGFVLVGFPTDFDQARELDTWLLTQGFRIDQALLFETRRASSSSPSAQGLQEANFNLSDLKLEILREQLQACVAFYKPQGKLLSVDATASTDMVLRQLSL